VSTDLKAGKPSSVVVFIFGLDFMESHLCEFSGTGFAEVKNTS